MSYIEWLLTSNYPTIIAVFIAAVCLAFMYYVALPAIQERNSLREQLASLQEAAPVSCDTEVSECLDSIRDVVMKLQAEADAARLAGNDSQRDMLNVVSEIRTNVNQLSARLLGLSNAVHLALNSSQGARLAGQGSDLRGLRE